MDNYSVKVVKANAQADESLLGVRLGRFCIANNISVIQVANALDVSKAVVYKWFTGKSDVGKHLRQKVEAYLEETPGALNTNQNVQT